MKTTKICIRDTCIFIHAINDGFVSKSQNSFFSETDCYS